MKTQISVLVKDESIFSKSMSLLWFINIFKKSHVLLTLDGRQIDLEASKKMHTFEVTPGAHTLQFSDPKAEQKSTGWKMTGGILDLVSVLMGGRLNTISAGAKSAEPDLQETIITCTLQEGDHFKVSCKCNNRGKIKIKQI